MVRRLQLFVVAIAAVTLFYCCQSWAERVPDSPEDATHVVTGTVRGVFHRETEEDMQYIVKIEVSDSETPKTVKASDVLLVYCFQRKPHRGLGNPAPGESGHTVVPKEGQQIRALAKYRHGTLQGLYPDWFTVVEAKKTK
jgi:hypothetical protein